LQLGIVPDEESPLEKRSIVENPLTEERVMTGTGQIQFGLYLLRSPAEKISGSSFVKQLLDNLDKIHRQLDSVWTSDHFFGSPQHPDYPALEGWTTLCYLAHAFPNLHFGNIVLAQSYRNPALLAKMGATLQLLTGGRFILGIGAGWWEEEYLAYGYPFPKPAVRVRQLAEAVQIIRKLWTEPRATFEGKYYQVREALCEPKPHPRPPIMIGGGGEQLTLRMVAQHADWWNIPSTTLERYTHKLNILRTHCQAVGRDYDEIVKTACAFITIGQTEAEAQRIQMSSPYRDVPGIVGSPDQVANQLQAYVDLGVKHIIVAFADFPDPTAATLFAEEVLPRFR
jgi:alkanesulfonate monooxygenase SsuD/methylene tetrahydromethanopterin reductase-like flavin-dependent oxidoreductase (luciferase family)